MIATHLVDSKDRLGILLIQLHQSAIQSHDGPHQVIAISAIAFIDLLQTFDLHKEGLFLSDLGSCEMVQLGRVLFTFNLPCCNIRTAPRIAN